MLSSYCIGIPKNFCERSEQDNKNPQAKTPNKNSQLIHQKSLAKTPQKTPPKIHVNEVNMTLPKSTR
jgi:hypothetical protein